LFRRGRGGPEEIAANERSCSFVRQIQGEKPASQLIEPLGWERRGSGRFKAIKQDGGDRHGSCFRSPVPRERLRSGNYGRGARDSWKGRWGGKKRALVLGGIRPARLGKLNRSPGFKRPPGRRCRPLPRESRERLPHVGSIRLVVGGRGAGTDVMIPQGQRGPVRLVYGHFGAGVAGNEPISGTFAFFGIKQGSTTPKKREPLQPGPAGYWPASR